MSLRRAFRSLERAVRPVVKAAAPVVTAALPGPIGAVARTVAAARAVRPPSPPQPAQPSFPEPAAMSMLGPLGAVLPGVGQVATRVARSRVGQVVTGVGGAVATGMVIDAVTGRPVKVQRRRRSKGITGRELKAFTRVTQILNKYCKTPAPTRRRKGGRSCR